MRLTHVITRLIVGGAQENTVASVLAFRSRPGYQIQLLSGPTTGPEGSLEDRLAGDPGLLTVVPELVRPIHPGNDLLALHHLTRILRRSAPHIVHTHSGKAGFLGRWAAHRAGVPVVCHTIHGPSFGRFQSAVANFAFRSAERFAARFTTRFISVAQAMTDQYLRAGIGRPKQYTRIFSGFDLAPYLHLPEDPGLRGRLGIDSGEIVVGKIARLYKLKGHQDLFDIAPDLIRRFPRVKFLLVGDGVWRERFEEQACSRGLAERFVFAGLVPPEEIPRYLALMDVVVHLSRREGLPRVLPQALAAGRPVIAYDCDGAGEVCRSNETGYLLPPGDQAGLLDSLTRLIESPSLRFKLGHRGQQVVQEHFPLEKMIEALDRVYREALSDPRL